MSAKLSTFTPDEVISLKGMNGMDATEAARALTVWEDPAPLPILPDVPAFDCSLLMPVALRSYLQDTAYRMQAPPDFGAAAIVSVASILIGTKVTIRPKQLDNWTVTPNLWGLVVGRSGAGKSPCLDEAMRPLDRLCTQWFDEWQKAKEEWQLDQKVNELTATANKKAIEKKAKQSRMSKDEIKEALRSCASEETTPRQPILRRIKTSNASVEALAELMREHPHGLLLALDEVNGLLGKLSASEATEERAFYLSGFDGNKPHTTDRIGRGQYLHVDTVCLSVVGGIQPSVLQQYVRQATTGGKGDDGLLQRFQLAVWPDVNLSPEYVDQRPDFDAIDQAQAIFDRLAALPSPETNAPAWHFTEEAQELFKAWMQIHEPRLRQEDMHPAMVSHLTKYRSLVPSLALIFALIDTPQHSATGEAGRVDIAELDRAIRWVEYLEKHAQRIYSAATMPDTLSAQALIAKIREGKVTEGFTHRDVYRGNGWVGLKTADEVKQACNLLSEYDWIAPVEEPKGRAGGRPTVRYSINPKALDTAYAVQRKY